jgi:hypothetical protein
MTPFPITHRLVADRIDRYRDAATRRDLAGGRVRRPVRSDEDDR